MLPFAIRSSNGCDQSLTDGQNVYTHTQQIGKQTNADRTHRTGGTAVENRVVRAGTRVSQSRQLTHRIVSEPGEPGDLSDRAARIYPGSDRLLGVSPIIDEFSSQASHRKSEAAGGEGGS